MHGAHKNVSLKLLIRGSIRNVVMFATMLTFINDSISVT